MRITDAYIQNTYLSNLNQSKKTLSKLQTQIASQTKVQKISDSPLLTARINKLSEQISSNNTYSKSIDSGLSYLNSTTKSMEGMSTETQNILTNLAEAKNSVNKADLGTFAQKVKTSLQSIIQYSNTDVEGKYLFSGTNSASAPYSEDQKWFGNTKDIGGTQNIKISPTVEQKINISGEELFQSLLKQSGSVDKNAVVGTTTSNITELSSADGTKYSAAINYTKTADNTYSMSYSVTDSKGVQVTAGSNSLKFDAISGKLTTINGKVPSKIFVDNQQSKISFSIDVSSMTEGSATSVSGSLSQPTNMLNMIQSISDGLAAGNLPSNEQLTMLTDFNDRILSKLAEAGGIQNRLIATSDMMQSQTLELQSLLSKEQDVDVAKASIELQTAQYSTEILYKTSSMILPKSLVDYL